MSDLYTAVKRLNKRDQEFVQEYIRVFKECPMPHDGIVAARLHCTARTVRRRRVVLRAKGVPLPRLRAPGFFGVSPNRKMKPCDDPLAYI